MQKKFLYLTIGAVLIAPSLAVAAHNEITPADMRTTPAPTTLQSKVEGPSGELLATQPGEVEINQSDESMPSRVDTTSVNRGNITPADMRTTSVPNTLQSKVEGPSGELLATQPGEVELDSDTANRVQPLNMQHSAANYQPLIKGEVNSGNVTPADMRTTPAPVTLREKKQDPRGELLATQPGEIEFNESRRIVVR